MYTSVQFSFFTKIKGSNHLQFKMPQIFRMVNVVTAERIFRYIPIYSVKLTDVSCNYLAKANVPITSMDWL